MIKLNRVHHIAVICSDYGKSKNFYVDILGFKVENEFFRRERNSYKLDLSLNGLYTIELFSFPNPPERLSRPEAAGLRHIAFETDDIEDCISTLKAKEINVEPLRTDEFTGRKFTFIFDPDNLPIEIYEK
jgi:glyoxylase I family protein